MNVLSLFDGISCGQIALNRANISYDNYYASEIKPHAIKCTLDNYPNTIQLGGILNLKGSDLPKIDLFIGGSPCKGISRLNKNQEGLEHSESRLFWEYIRLLDEVKPKYYLLENTHGNKEATNTITETLGIKPISINSKLVSAQNRPRYYWTNIPDIKQPLDKGITTNDIFDYSGVLADECRVKWLNSESGKKSIKNGYTKVNPYPKSGCLTALGHKKWNENYLYRDGVYRYLSQTEIEKLQTLPVGYTKILSYDEAYDCIGDGWTVDVIAHIFKNIEI
jgi:DNA (cytosine-5)-methyltransferase 3A